MVYWRWCLLTLWIAFAACADEDATGGKIGGDNDAVSDDMSTTESDVITSVAKFSASMLLPGEDPRDFVANLGVKCSFQKLDQLLITATGASETASETVVLRVGVSKVSAIDPSGTEFPFKLVGVGKDVEPGTAAWSYETDGAVLLSPGLVDSSSKVVLTSLSPCKGTFLVTWTDVEGQSLSITGGEFEITLTE